MTRTARDRRHGQDGARGRRARAGARLVTSSRSSVERRRATRHHRRALLGGADVAVEFTMPAAAPANIRALRRGRLPGRRRHDGLVRRAATRCADVVSERGGALLTAPNFSLGVNIFEQIVDARRARVLARSAGVRRARSSRRITRRRRTHRRARRRRSPTARRTSVGPARSRSRACAPDPFRARTSSSSTRRSSRFDLEHIARDRRVFAEGALAGGRAGSSASAACSPCATCSRARSRTRILNDSDSTTDGMRHRARHAVQRRRERRRGRASRACRLADRRGHSLPRAVRQHGRGRDDDARRALPRRRDRRASRRTGRVPIVAGAASNDTQKAIELVQGDARRRRDAPAAHVADVQQAAAARHRRALSRRSPRPSICRSSSTTCPGARRATSRRRRRSSWREHPGHRRHEGSVRATGADRRHHSRTRRRSSPCSPATTSSRFP